MRIRLEHLEKGFDGVPVLRGIDFDDDVTTLAVELLLQVLQPNAHSRTSSRSACSRT